MSLFGAKGENNDAFDDGVGSAVLNNAQPSVSKRLPPLEQLEVAKPARSKAKSPRPKLDSDPAYTNGDTIMNGDDETTPRETRKKKKKRRPNSAEKDKTIQLTNGHDTNGHLSENSPSPGIANGERSDRTQFPLPPTITRTDSDGIQPAATSSSLPAKDHEVPAKPPREKLSSQSSNHDTQENQDPVVRPKDPHRSIEANVRIENHQGTDSLRPNVIPRTPSAASLRKLETVDGNHEEIDEIQMAPEVERLGSRSPRPILKQTSTEDHVTNMFMAGSRPPSANSTKQTVRISDEVTYSDTNLKRSANRPRPKSSHKTAQNGHAKKPDFKSKVLQDAVNGSYDHWRLKQTTQRKISPHFKTSIFTMIFCGIFPGAAALYFSFQSRQAMKKGKRCKSLSQFVLSYALNTQQCHPLKIYKVI